MDRESYLAVVRGESERFLEALAGVPGDARVPSCPDWTAADLLWHLAEVQHQWARVVAGARPPDVGEPPRPDDPVELRRLVATSGTELLAALADTPPETPIWSWHPDGGTVGWAVRRMAHEALVHRVDAELTAGLEPRPPSVELAADGVDEVLTVFLAGLPAWGRFAPDGVTVVVRCTNAPGAWRLALGRFTGTSPTTGTAYDLDAAEVWRLRGEGSGEPGPGGEGASFGEAAAPGRAAASGADLVVAGHAWDLDRWLWGRGPVEPLEITGDRGLEERVRALLRDATQ